MAIRKIIRFPAASLRVPCRDIPSPLTDEVLEHIQDLRDTLAATPNGVALASNQILAEGWRVFVVKPETGLQEVVINPIWEPIPDPSGQGKWTENEGCLSIPEANLPVARYYIVQLDYQDETGKKFVDVVRRMASRVVQHECDHLDGKLIYDYADPKVQIHIRAQAIKNRKEGR